MTNDRNPEIRLVVSHSESESHRVVDASYNLATDHLSWIPLSVRYSRGFNDALITAAIEIGGGEPCDSE